MLALVLFLESVLLAIVSRDFQGHPSKIHNDLSGYGMHDFHLTSPHPIIQCKFNDDAILDGMVIDCTRLSNNNH